MKTYSAQPEKKYQYIIFSQSLQKMNHLESVHNR
jgi:hypothetical protein